LPMAIPFSSYITEITTESKLLEEGSNMKHCVGGYGQKVKDGECRIFHIDHNGVHSTLEIEIHSGEIHFNRVKKETSSKIIRKNQKSIENKKTRSVIVYSIKQHKAKLNQRPSAINLKIAEMLVRSLNPVLNYHCVKSLGQIVTVEKLSAKN
jgi:hypothetical protein